MKRLLLLATLCLSACAGTNNSDDSFEAQDPIKPVNEQIFAFNLAADKWAIKPVASTYHLLPGWSRASVDNFLTNLGEPSNAVNGILQRNPEIAFTSFWRFALNSTFGFAGLRDFAGENGLKNMDTDFGKTLGSYGVADGAYIVLPLAGPSTVRDTGGKVVDWFIDPVGWFMNMPETVAQVVVDGIDTRDEQDPAINQLYYQSLEPYSATRAAYLQHKNFNK